VTGLTLAFAAGEVFSYPRLLRVLSDLRLERAGQLVRWIAPLGNDERLALLQERAPRWARPFVSRFRYIVLAMLRNLPGTP
jgi:hypothetical protein